MIHFGELVDDSFPAEGCELRDQLCVYNRELAIHLFEITKSLSLRSGEMRTVWVRMAIEVNIYPEIR